MAALRFLPALMLIGLAFPALAEPSLNKTAIAECLRTKADAPTECLADVLYPCLDQTGAGRLRNCFHRLGGSWEAETGATTSRFLKENRPWMQLFVLLEQDGWQGAMGNACQEAANELLGSKNAANARVVDRACAVFDAATWWHRLAGGSATLERPLAALLSDVESMELCVRKAGEDLAQDCTGVITKACINGGTPMMVCLGHERRVWMAIAQERLGALSATVSLRDLPSRHRGQHETGCGADDGSVHYLRCQMRSIARIASELVLSTDE
ncbi:MAG: hypothetical protein AAF557_19605 [Pseudomonadota bacterium]